MIFTAAQLLEIMPEWPKTTVEQCAALLGHEMGEAGINTVLRAACFLGQVRHESGGGRYWREIADGMAYEGRADLGNTEIGDGPRFRGHGLLQVTGRQRHRELGARMGLDLEVMPELLELPEHGIRSATLIWREMACSPGWLSRRAQEHGVPLNSDLSMFADLRDTPRITWAINGGLNGLQWRQLYSDKARMILERTGQLA